MKYIVTISVVSLLALTACFERQEPAPIVDDQDVMMEDDAMMNDDMNWDDDAMMNDDMNVDVQVESEVEMSDAEMDEIEEDLEALFQDILGE